MQPAALDAACPPPRGLGEPQAKREALRHLATEMFDRPRRDPFRMPARVESVELAYCGGTGRACAWRFSSVDIGGGPLIHYVLGFEMASGSYCRALDADEQEPGELLERLVADGLQMAQLADSILDRYRDRVREDREDPERHYELALVGASLWEFGPSDAGESYVETGGPLGEPVAAAAAACERDASQAAWHAFAGYLHERALELPSARRHYAEATGLERKAVVPAFLQADSLLFSGDLPAAREAAAEAERRARSRRQPLRFGLHRPSVIGAMRDEILERAWDVRKRIEGLSDAFQSEEEAAEEQRRLIQIAPERVPADFRDLIPLVQKWGVGDDAARGFFVDNATAREQKQLRDALRQRREALEKWIASFDADEMPDEAGSFQDMLIALEEMDV